MSKRVADSLRHQLHALTAPVGEIALTDNELLQCYHLQGDEEAFTALVQRHGGLVLQTARRMLDDRHAAEDVFQGAFLILAQKAATIRKRVSLAAWLYRVTFRLALRRRAQLAKDRALGAARRTAVAEDPLATLSARELLTVLDEELQRLPERHRSALVLCYLQDQTHAAAAAQLHCRLATLRSRLQTGKRLLRRRLQRRGVTLPATTLVLALSGGAGQAVAPAMMALALAARKSLGAAAHIPEHVQSLVNGAEQALPAAKLRLSLGVISLFSSLLIIGGWIIWTNCSGGKVTARPANRIPLAEGAEKPPLTRDSHGDPLPARAVGRFGGLRFRHGSYVTALAYSADSKQVASAGINGEVWIWDRATGKRLRRLSMPKDSYPVQEIGFSPDGTKLVSVTFSDQSFGVPKLAARLVLWDLATGKQLLVRNERVFLFAPDGKVLYTGGDKIFVLPRKFPSARLVPSGTDLRRWDTTTGKELQRIGKGYPVAVSADGKRLATVLIPENGQGQILLVWDAVSGKELRRLPVGDEWIAGAAFSRDGLCYWTRADITKDSSAKKVWRWPAGKSPKQLLKTGAQKFNFLFSRDGKRLAWKEADRLRVHDLSTMKELCRISSPLLSYKHPTVSTMAVSPDGRQLVTAIGHGGALAFWDVGSGRELPDGKGHKAGVRSVHMSPDGKTIYSVGNDGTLRFWDRRSGKQRRRINHPYHGWFGGGDLSSDGKVLAVGGARVQLWRTSDGKLIRDWRIADDKARQVAISPDGKYVAGILTRKYQAAMWEAATGKLIWKKWVDKPTGGTSADLQGVAFSPDGRLLAVCGNYLDVHLLCAETGKEISRFRVEPAQPYTYNSVSLAFSPDGRTLAAGHQETIHVWELATGGRRLTMKSSQQSGVLMFSPDSQSLVAACNEKIRDSGYRGATLRFLDLATGTEYSRLNGHCGTILHAAFSRDGKCLVSSSMDSTVMAWETPVRENRPVGGSLTKSQFASLWRKLTERDAERAWYAQIQLAHANNAVELLKGVLEPARRVDPVQAARWIKDLDSSRFRVRRQAQEKLLEFVDQIGPALRAELKKPITLEMHQRIDILLKQLTRPEGKRLQMLRALEVLEQNGSPAARATIARLSQGAAGAMLTSEARAAARRLTP